MINTKISQRFHWLRDVGLLFVCLSVCLCVCLFVCLRQEYLKGDERICMKLLPDRIGVSQEQNGKARG